MSDADEIYTKKVFTSLNNAISNGHNLKIWPAGKIVDNMMDFADGYSDANIVKLTAAVKMWLKQTP